MPIINSQFTLSDTTATQIVEPENMIQEVTIHNMSKASVHYVFLGNSSVSTSNGLHVDPGENVQLRLRPLDDLWAVSDPDGLEIGVLVVMKRD